MTYRIPADEERATKGEDGKWHALNEDGEGHDLHYESQELAQAWLDGYVTALKEHLAE